jgi:CheY-like chemotaxis protein
MPKILVVHADTEKRTAICRALQAQGNVVIEAGDGLEALGLLETDHNLVIAHESLPKSDGWRLLHCIKRSPETEHTIVILLLDDFNNARIFAAHRQGVDSVLEATDEAEVIAHFAIELLELKATGGEYEPCDPWA